MVNYQKNSTVSVGLVKILNAYANRLDVDFKKVARFCDFDICILNNSEARVSSKFFESMWMRIRCLSSKLSPKLNLFFCSNFL